MSRFSTAYLLTCAAIGVAGGVVLVLSNWLSTLLSATVPFVSTALAGLWLLPAVVALRLLERPLAGLLVGLISGLVTAAFSGYGLSSVATNLWWMLFAELPFLIALYRYWKTWQYYLGALVVGIVYPLSAWAWFDLGALALPARIAFFAITTASAAAGVLLGILVADRLRRAGIARIARRRVASPPSMP